MNSRVIVGLALTGVVALVSCSQDRTPQASLPTEALYGKGGSTSSCSFSNASRDAKAYLIAQKGALYDALDVMQEAYRTGGAAGATAPGMNVLALLGTAANNGANQVKGTPAQGNLFANDVIACMAGFPPTDFTEALGATGLFAVRDGTVGYAVVAHHFGTDGKPTTGAPLYGAEPTGATWPLAQKTLFYGHVLTTTTIADETPAGTVFELTTWPANLTFVPEIRTGVCTVGDATARILHAHAGDPAVILPPAGLPSFCTNPPPLWASRSGFGSVMDLAASWFTPRPLYAAMPAFDDGGGGLVSGLSEIGPVIYTSVVSYTVAPQNTTVSANPQFTPTVAVLDTTSNGNPLKGVTITLNVVGNNGSFNITGNVAVTDASGVATFPNLHIDKAGGYTVTAVSEVGGSAVANFQINGQ
jgi:hypothetical protein